VSDPITIAVDGMGGDNGPSIVIQGLDIARVRHPDVKFSIFGIEAELTPLISGYPALGRVCQITPSPDVVKMHDKPAQALRRGRKTSMWMAIASMRKQEATAVVSAGNTGALMAMSWFQLRTIPGIDRPAIAAIWPTTRAESVVLDVGANIGADEKQLVDFAIMGAEFARAVFSLERPTVGLLNIGSEELKGNEHVKAAAQALRDARGLPMDFRGFVEGDDIGKGTVDVVVTDGFTGNIALKTAEGTARQISGYLREAFSRSLLSRIGYFFAKGAMEVFRRKVDPSRVNGGVFLGLNGLVVKSHGGTDGPGFASAVDLAIDMARANVTGSIARDVQRVVFGDESERAARDVPAAEPEGNSS